MSLAATVDASGLSKGDRELYQQERDRPLARSLGTILSLLFIVLVYSTCPGRCIVAWGASLMTVACVLLPLAIVGGSMELFAVFSSGLVWVIVGMAKCEKENRPTPPKIEKLLRRGQFKEAEQMIKDLQTHRMQYIGGDRFDLDLMICLDQALNGQGKDAEADEVARQIQKHWQDNLRTEWISQGRPEKGSCHTRLILRRSCFPGLRVLAKQYYDQLDHEDLSRGAAVFKFVVAATSRKNCDFKLLKTSATTAVLQNEREEDVKSYDGSLPDIRLVARDVMGYMTKIRSIQGPSSVSTKLASSLGGKSEEGYGKATVKEEEDLDWTEVSRSSSSEFDELL